MIVRNNKKKNLNEGRVVFHNGAKYQYLKENEQSEEMVEKIVDLYNEILENCTDVVAGTGAIKGKNRISTKVDLSDEAYDLDILDQTVEMGEEYDPISVTIKGDGSIIFGDSNFIQHYLDANNVDTILGSYLTAEVVITYKSNGQFLVEGRIKGLEKLTLHQILG